MEEKGYLKKRRPPDRITLFDLVSLVVQAKDYHPAVAWGLTLVEIQMVLSQRQDQQSSASNAFEAAILAARLDERIELYERLTEAERLELEEWKAVLM